MSTNSQLLANNPTNEGVNTSTNRNTKYQSPKWLDKTAYPFSHNFQTIDGQQMHYIDEGPRDAPVVLLVHGTPTWSFLYREMVKNLAQNYRTIAIDHIGFGLSDKPKQYDYSAQNLAQNLAQFIDHMQLKNITLVVHDFGGPIGLSYAVNHPENVAQIILFNTWMWETKSDEGVQKIDRILHSGIGKFLYKQLNFSANVLLKKGFYNKKQLSKKTHGHYKKVFPKVALRNGPLLLGHSLLGNSDWYEQLWEKRGNIADKKILILWGTEDEFFQERHLQKWTSNLNQYQLVKFKAGHFPQEEFPVEVNKEIEMFLMGE